MSDARRLLIEGLCDAIGFVGGALVVIRLGQWIGWDLFSEGYDSLSIGAILLVGLGGGAGLHLARAWRRAQRKG